MRLRLAWVPVLFLVMGCEGWLDAQFPAECRAGQTPAVACVWLTGTATDPEGDPLTVLWELVEGPGEVKIGHPDQLDTWAAFTASGVYTLKVSVSDGINEPVTAETRVTVEPKL